jgi:hypothetical protein
MEGVLVQPLTTIAGGSNVVVTQGAGGWIDLGDLEDVVFYLHVRELSGGASMTYQTSPTKQEASFMALAPRFTLQTGVRVDRALFGFAQVPPARFVRWQLSGSPGTGWDVTFQLWIAGRAMG